MSQTEVSKAGSLVAIREFLKLESASGILLVVAGVLAMIAANSPLADGYEALLQTHFKIQLGEFALDKPLGVWVNDLLMAIFFLLVGLEIKREAVMGELSDASKVALPAIAALGGMIVPAAIYAALNWNDPVGIRGWAIPSATDIAFALGVLSLFGERVPVGLKIFLMTLAVLDDLGAIVIIAIFYTYELSTMALMLAGLAVVTLLVLNRLGVMRVAPYVLVGTALWLCVLKSGVHATLAGVVTALCIPARGAGDPEHTPLRRLEHSLHPWVAFGIMLGLFVGKQVGVFGFAWTAVKLGIAKLPSGVTFRQVYGAAIICGIGFTMSMFIGMLAFENVPSGEEIVTDQLGILAGSLVSALVGYVVLHFVLPKGRCSHP
jgi:NhaA family Na+:H+ antiporter